MRRIQLTCFSFIMHSIGKMCSSKYLDTIWFWMPLPMCVAWTLGPSTTASVGCVSTHSRCFEDKNQDEQLENTPSDYLTSQFVVGNKAASGEFKGQVKWMLSLQINVLICSDRASRFLYWQIARDVAALLFIPNWFWLQRIAWSTMEEFWNPKTSPKPTHRVHCIFCKPFFPLIRAVGDTRCQ